MAGKLESKRLVTQRHGNRGKRRVAMVSSIVYTKLCCDLCDERMQKRETENLGLRMMTSQTLTTRTTVTILVWMAWYHPWYHTSHGTYHSSLSRGEVGTLVVIVIFTLDINVERTTVKSIRYMIYRSVYAPYIPE